MLLKDVAQTLNLSVEEAEERYTVIVEWLS